MDDTNPLLVFDFAYICAKMVAYYDHIFSRGTSSFTSSTSNTRDLGSKKEVEFEEDEKVILGVTKRVCRVRIIEVTRTGHAIFSDWQLEAGY